MRIIGQAIGTHPWAFVLASLALLLPLLSFFFVGRVVVDTDVRRGFAHKNGRSTQEFKVFGDFYNVSTADLELLVVLVEAKDGHSRMPLTAQLLQGVTELDAHVLNTKVVSSDNGTLTIRNAVTSRGTINYLFNAFKLAFDLYADEPEYKHEDVVLDYPTSSVLGHRFSIVPHFFGVQKFNDTNEHFCAIESVQVIALWYMLNSRSDLSKAVLEQMEVSLYEESRNRNFSHLFNFHTYADQIANHEMTEGSVKTIRLLAVGIALMLMFMTISMWDLPWHAMALLIPTALFCPMLAAAATFAILGWLGFAFNSIMSICPFLILGIGVDDGFLLVHSWRRHHELAHDPPARMATVVAEVGPSVFITSFTNSLAFGIGIFSPSVQMSSFCLCTTVAVVLDMLLEFSIFAPCMVLCQDASDRKPPRQLRRRNNDPDDDEDEGASWNRVWTHYANFLTSIPGRTFAIAICVLLYSTAYLGTQRMDATFEPQKTFPADSHLQESIRVINKVYVQYAPLSFIVDRAPDLSNSTDIAAFLTLIGDLEALPESSGPNGTQLWLRDYLEYDRKVFERNRNALSAIANRSVAYEPSYRNVPQFLSDNFLDDKSVVHYHYEEGEVVVDNFIFVVICHGERNWHERAFFIDKLRQMIDQYESFKVTVFDYDATIFDLIITVKQEMFKAVLITLVCMTVVCFLIIPSVPHTGVAAASIVSISFCLLGLLGWWGQEMDPVTMINVLMAIGYSVDFSAHVCYHYYQHRDVPDATGARITAKILNSVGRPTLEAAASTLTCIVPLFFIPVYVVESFAKTVFCVGLLGILHGLFVIPVALAWLHRLRRRTTPHSPASSKRALSDSGSEESQVMLPPTPLHDPKLSSQFVH